MLYGKLLRNSVPPTCFMKFSWFVYGPFRVSLSEDKVTLITNVISCTVLLRTISATVDAFLCLNPLRVHQFVYYPCDMSCTQLGRLAFVLTNQDSEGGKYCTVVTVMYFMYVNMKGIEVWQLLLLETALDIQEKELKIQETTSDYKM